MSHNALKLRAQTLRQIRDFFAARHVMEVETPLLSQHTVNDIYIESFATEYLTGNQQKTYYLQTSPEYAMKRLLANGSGSIFQICKAFRNGESGGLHNPEFSMLEWYRLGFNHHDLMAEMDDLLQTVLECKPAVKKSYQQLFRDYLQLDPLQCELKDLHNAMIKYEINLTQPVTEVDRDTSLQLLLSHRIEPKLGFDAPCFIYDFPHTQAALSRIRNDNPPVAERFEVYIQGLEIANGFHELNDAAEQLRRFQNEQTTRQERGLRVNPIDHNLIDALKTGLPDCAGVALGIDRLLMVKAKTTQIKDVINFVWHEA